MIVRLSCVYPTQNPDEWNLRKCFNFHTVNNITISDLNEFQNHEVIIKSDEFPIIRYKEKGTIKYKEATLEDLKAYCHMENDNIFIFHQVQGYSIEFGKSCFHQ